MLFRGAFTPDSNSHWGDLVSNDLASMKFSPDNLLRSSRLIITIGTLSLGAMVLFQAFGVESVASASSRDEFPGRRQGGGTHWVMPTEAVSIH